MILRLESNEWQMNILENSKLNKLKDISSTISLIWNLQQDAKSK